MSVNNTLFIERQVFCSLRKCCKGLDIGYPDDIKEVCSSLWPPTSEPNPSQNNPEPSQNQPTTPSIVMINWGGNPIYNNSNYNLSDLFLISMIMRNLEARRWESQPRPQDPNKADNDAVVAMCLINFLVIVVGVVAIAGTLGEWCHQTVESLEHSWTREGHLLKARSDLQSCDPGSREDRVKIAVEKALILEKQFRKMQRVKLAAAIMLTIAAIILTLSFVVCSTMALVSAPGALIGMYAIVAGATSGGLILTAIIMLTARCVAMRKAEYDAIFREGYRPLSELTAESRREREAAEVEQALNQVDQVDCEEIDLK